MYITILIGLLILFLDQFSKHWILGHLALNSSKILDNPLINIMHVHNTGGAWNIMNNKVNYLVIISVIVIIYFIKLSIKHKKSSNFVKLIYGLIIGGALGNLIDRIYLGYVIDMIQLKFISFPIFNVADMAISTGIFLLIIYIIKYDEESII